MQIFQILYTMNPSLLAVCFSVACVLFALVINDLEMDNVELAYGEDFTSYGLMQTMWTLNISFKKNLLYELCWALNEIMQIKDLE